MHVSSVSNRKLLMWVSPISTEPKLLKMPHWCDVPQSSMRHPPHKHSGPPHKEPYESESRNNEMLVVPLNQKPKCGRWHRTGLITIRHTAAIIRISSKLKDLL